jgi:hypothetical protein
MWPVGPCDNEGEGDRLAQSGDNKTAKKALFTSEEKHGGSEAKLGANGLETRARSQIKRLPPVDT